MANGYAVLNSFLLVRSPVTVDAKNRLLVTVGSRVLPIDVGG
jgi:hypothetical protein